MALDRTEISKEAFHGDVHTNKHSLNRQGKFRTYALGFMLPVSGKKVKEICSKPFHIWPNGRWHWTGREYPKGHSMEMSIRTRIHSIGKGSFGHIPWDLCLRFPGRRLRRFVVSLFIAGETVDGIGLDGNIQKEPFHGAVHTNTHSFNRQGKFRTYTLGFMLPVPGKKAKRIVVTLFITAKNLVAENVFHSIAGLCGKRIQKVSRE